MSGIKQFIYDQQNDLEDEIHPREHRCVHVQEILATMSFHDHTAMQDEMDEPEANDFVVEASSELDPSIPF